MARTQIYLGDEEVRLLDRESSETGASRSELIRRAVRRAYGGGTSAERLRALERSAASWGGRELSGADYVDGLRGDLDERLGKLGLG